MEKLWWDLEKIQRLLWPVDVQRLCQIPIGNLSSPDKLIWNQSITLKSCYYFAKNLQGSDSRGESGQWILLGGSNSQTAHSNKICKLCCYVLKHLEGPKCAGL